ncbi:hypothetical protein, partial [Thauera sp. 28]|uniref:hypothetical protein n=1 Tax=Thauera sp. 28 TaxID=303682 RepID=UPI001E5250AA
MPESYRLTVGQASLDTALSVSASAASFSGPAPGGVAFSPSRLAPLLQQTVARLPRRSGASRELFLCP